MKKTIFITLLLSVFQILNIEAQETQKKYILGGGINFIKQENTSVLSNIFVNSQIEGDYSSNLSGGKNKTFAFSPYFAKQIKPSLTFGGYINYRTIEDEWNQITLSNNTTPLDLNLKSKQFGIGLFTRHVLNPCSKVKFFIQPYVEYNTLNKEELQDGSTARDEVANYIEIGTGLGVLYTINHRVNFIVRTGGLAYQSGTWELKGTYLEKDFSSFGTNVNLLSSFLGLEIKI